MSKKNNVKDKSGVRTKTVFGKPLGNSSLIIFLALVLVITGLSWWLVTSTVQKDIDKYNKDISSLKTQINRLKNQKYEELIDTSVFMSALPQSINPEEVRNEITNAARSAGIDVLAPNLPITYKEDAEIPTSIEGLSQSVKSYFFYVNISAKDPETLLAFINNIYGSGGVSTRIYYIDGMEIQGMDQDVITASFNIYTFYRPAN